MPSNRNFPTAELFKSLLPITPMGKLMCAGVIVWFIDWVFVDGSTLWGSPLLKTFFDIGSALAFLPLAYFAFNGAGWLKENLLWRLRQRLIVTYLLIGALPVLLLLFLMGLIGYAVVTQDSVGLVSRKLDNYQDQSRAVAEALSRDLLRPELTRLPADELRQKLQERANALSAIFPDLRLSIRRPGQSAPIVWVQAIAAGQKPVSAMRTSPPELELPFWLNEFPYHGLVLEKAPVRQLHARHILKFGDLAPAIFELSYPIGRALSVNLGQAANLGVRPGLGYRQVVMTSNGPLLQNATDAEQGYLQQGGFPILKKVADWQSGETIDRDALLVDLSFMTLSYIWGRVQQFKSSGVIGNSVFLVLSALSIVLLLIALSAIISAIFLTRSITRAVHHLYLGTKRVEKGEFDNEIPIFGRDQLGELAISFNRMTGSIRELLSVSAQKQRLDQEMKIAAKVQTRLLPRSLPKTEMLDFAPGICIPARAVSGDYYDFIEAAKGRIGVVIADVCGKGVSAALMMANLQANLRGQVQAYYDADDYRLAMRAQAPGVPSGGEISSADYSLHSRPVQRIVHRVNQQLAEAMIDASYITFFYAEFDDRDRTLRYTNAGHNPPLLHRKDGGRIERLDRGGTVLGLFREAEYEEAQLQLEPGDVLVAFTDGLIEARAFGDGEEFGEDRLIDALRLSAHLSAAEIEQHLLDRIRRWTANADQEDDLTLVIFKVR